MALMEVILLERVDNLGRMGETVRVKPGYARNFLLPQKKALRATNENKAFYEAQRAELEKRNADKRAEAEKLAKKLDGFKASVIRNAAEAGALYGSVTTRDVAEAVSTQAKISIDRTQVLLSQGFKSVGLFPVTLALHPEVKINVTINIARTAEEAKIQAETGKALVAVDERTAEANARAEADAARAEKAALLEAEGLAVEQDREEKAEAKKSKKTAKSDQSEDAPEAAEAE